MSLITTEFFYRNKISSTKCCSLIPCATQGVRVKGTILSRERMAPFKSPKRTRGEAPSPPDIGSLYLEKLHTLRNQVRCTWLRHESLRFATYRSRALLS